VKKEIHGLFALGFIEVIVNVFSFFDVRFSDALVPSAELRFGSTWSNLKCVECDDIRRVKFHSEYLSQHGAVIIFVVSVLIKEM
jgi:hypothetical protein